MINYLNSNETSSNDSFQIINFIVDTYFEPKASFFLQFFMPISDSLGGVLCFISSKFSTGPTISNNQCSVQIKVWLSVHHHINGFGLAPSIGSGHGIYTSSVRNKKKLSCHSSRRWYRQSGVEVPTTL